MAPFELYYYIAFAINESWFSICSSDSIRNYFFLQANLLSLSKVRKIDSGFILFRLKKFFFINSDLFKRSFLDYLLL